MKQYPLKSLNFFIINDKKFIPFLYNLKNDKIKLLTTGAVLEIDKTLRNPAKSALHTMYPDDTKILVYTPHLLLEKCLKSSTVFSSRNKSIVNLAEAYHNSYSKSQKGNVIAHYCQNTIINECDMPAFIVSLEEVYNNLNTEKYIKQLNDEIRNF